jgi:UDPglucose--hexose-1-phosphate uridylyltransferase
MTQTTLAALATAPHHRRNPLTGDWVLVSPHRMQRPWQGQVDAPPGANLPAHDPACYLCPRNPRAGGATNPDYQGTFVFDNDFPALLPHTPTAHASEAPWMEARSETGLCRVICYSPRHDVPFGRLPPEAALGVIQTWTDQVRDLYSRPSINCVQLFENRGEGMGASSPHPHGQLWATSQLSNEVDKEDRAQAAWYATHGSPLLTQVLDFERRAADRLVFENDLWSVLVPFWATWPFETLVLPRFAAPCLTDLDLPQQRALADIWQRLCNRYDQLFGTPMPLSCGLHLAPKASPHRQAWQLHAHFFPVLLRSATVRKFMVGYEMLAGPQRDLTPEEAARRLRGDP